MVTAIISKNTFLAKLKFYFLRIHVGGTEFAEKNRLINKSQSYKRNLVLKKTKLVLKSYTVHYLNLD
jgi:hypothetical protein